MDKKIIAYRNKKMIYSGRNRGLLSGASLYYFQGQYCFINYLVDNKEPLVSKVYKIKDFSGESISCYNHIYEELLLEFMENI